MKETDYIRQLAGICKERSLNESSDSGDGVFVITPNNPSAIHSVKDYIGKAVRDVDKSIKMYLKNKDKVYKLSGYVLYHILDRVERIAKSLDKGEVSVNAANDLYQLANLDFDTPGPTDPVDIA